MDSRFYFVALETGLQSKTFSNIAFPNAQNAHGTVMVLLSWNYQRAPYSTASQKLGKT
jgi:hypothetical protein